MSENSRVCPKCNSTELGEGILRGYAAMMPIGRLSWMGSPILATICTHCGHINDMKVKDPEIFVKE